MFDAKKFYFLDVDLTVATAVEAIDLGCFAKNRDVLVDRLQTKFLVRSIAFVLQQKSQNKSIDSTDPHLSPNSTDLPALP